MSDPHGSTYLGDGTTPMSEEARETLIADTAYDSYEGSPRTGFVLCPACALLVDDDAREKMSHLTHCTGDPTIMERARDEVSNA